MPFRCMTIAHLDSTQAIRQRERSLYSTQHLQVSLDRFVGLSLPNFQITGKICWIDFLLLQKDPLLYDHD